jgi:uncharacterized protein
MEKKPASATKREEQGMGFLRISALVCTILACIIFPARAGEIHCAARCGETERIKSILRKNPGVINEKNETGYTPLDVAAENGQVEAARVLIEAGADVNACSGSAMCRTPLHCAAGSEHESAAEIITLLVKNGARIEAKDKGGGTPLCNSIISGTYAATRRLVMLGANVNMVVPEEKCTPLFLAVMMEKYDTTKFLLEHGASPSLKCSNNTCETPLDYARRKNLRTFVTLLEQFSRKK